MNKLLNLSKFLQILKGAIHKGRPNVFHDSQNLKFSFLLLTQQSKDFEIEFVFQQEVVVQKKLLKFIQNFHTTCRETCIVGRCFVSLITN